MALDLKITGGTLVAGRSRIRAGLGIKAGRIALVAADTYLPEANHVIDATGLHVLPGVMDVHIHTRDPGFTHLEDFETASAAAAAGGVTLVIDMPGTDEPILANVAAFENKVGIVQGRSYVNFAFRGAILPSNLNDILPLAEAGVVAFKVQMGQSVRSPTVDDGVLLRCFELAAAAGRPMGIHAENNGVVSFLTKELKHQGRHDALAHFESRPNVVEAEAIQRAIVFARQAGNHLHVHHMSSRQGIEALAAAKAHGLPVTGETCPHYLLLDSGDYAQLGSVMKVNPSIKTPADREALWQALRDGVIDILATDHAPHSNEEKLQDDIWRAVAGFAGVETLVPLMLGEVNRGRMNLEDFVRATAERPARIFGLYPRKGSLAIGSDADITIVDMAHPWIVESKKLHSKTKISPFDGREGIGAPVYTIVGGNLVAREGEVIGPPVGRLVCPSPSLQ